MFSSVGKRSSSADMNSMVCSAAVNRKEVILKESHKTLEQVLGSLIWLQVDASQVKEVRSDGLETIMLTDFLPYVIQVECLTIQFLEITGQKLAIWPSSKSRWAFFWVRVSGLASGTSKPSLVIPLRGLAAVSFCQVASRKGTKFLSIKRTWIKFCCQLSYEVIVSIIVNCHYLGGRGEAAMLESSLIAHLK